MKYETICLTCEEEEKEKKHPKRVSWITSTTSQARCILDTHKARYDLHELKIKEQEKHINI